MHYRPCNVLHSIQHGNGIRQQCMLALAHLFVRNQHRTIRIPSIDAQPEYGPYTRRNHAYQQCTARPRFTRQRPETLSKHQRNNQQNQCMYTNLHIANSTLVTASATAPRCDRLPIIPRNSKQENRIITACVSESAEMENEASRSI